jgi:hypothetical protein
MPRLEFDLDTTLSPEQAVAALTDFTERRPEIWQSLSPDAYQVFSVGETWAEVREGSRTPKVWARERYDWSTPGVVRWEVTESNFSNPGSYVETRISPAEGGGSRIHLVWDRTATSLKWKALMTLIVLSRGAPIKSSLKKGLDRFASMT